MWVILLSLQVHSSCTISKYFLDCDSSHTRDIIVTGSADCLDSYPRIIKSSKCDKSCPPGTYLEVLSSTQDCTPCPFGSFSVGGGFFYGKEGTPWTSALTSIINDCWVNINGTDFHNYNCQPWQVTDNNLASSKLNSSEPYTASLTFSLKLVKPGKLSIKYRKDTYKLNGHQVGLLKITKNLESVLEDNEIDQSSWKEFDLDLDVGNHEVVIDYLSKRIDTNLYPQAFISSVQVFGTKFADTECYSCHFAGSKTGATSCQVCDFNEYLSNGVCQACPDGTYSLQGASTVKDCITREPCTVSDYKPKYSECVNGVRSLSYEWRHPVFCDFSSFKLPETSANEPCEACQTGYYSEVLPSGASHCVSCPGGSVLETANNSCKACPAGTYAPKQLNISDWTDLPEEFSTYCVTYNGFPCPHSIGWVASTSYLTTSLGNHSDCEIFLNRNITILSNFGFVKVDFDFTTNNNGSIDVYVDGLIIESWQAKNEGFVHLAKGSHFVQWAYWGQSIEEVRIYSVSIFGGTEGAATQCVSCEKGFTSLAGQDECVACGPGTTSNGNQTACVKCPSDFYTHRSGTPCTKCPSGTNANANQTTCTGIAYAYFNGSSYLLANITGSGVEGVYSAGVCNVPSAQFFCHQTFYGPLPSENIDFYISILNPSQLVLPNAEFYYEQSSGFAFAVVKKETLTGVDGSDSCVQQRAILNLGSVVAETKPIPGGFEVVYGRGDVCGPLGFYNSSISVLCDKDAGVGWPSFDKVIECSYHFWWTSKFGCRVCLDSEMQTVVGECVNGKRVNKRGEAGNCIAPEEKKKEWTEDCSEAREVMNEWPVIIGLCLLGLLTLLALISFVFYKKYSNDFIRLQEVRDQ